MRHGTIGLLAAALLVPLGAGEASAQGREGPAARYSGVVNGGWTQYDAAAGLQDAGYAGFEVLYQVNRFLSVGPYMTAARPRTDETYFPFVRLEFADTVFNYLLSQQLMTFDYGLGGAVDVPLGPVVLEGIGGIGRYAVRLDPERSSRPVVRGTEVTGFSGMQYVLGGGVKVPVAGGALRLHVRNLVYTDYERETLSLSDPLLGHTAIPHPNPNPPAAESTINNLRYELGFNFAIGGGR